MALRQCLQRKDLTICPHYITGPLNATADAISQNQPAPKDRSLIIIFFHVILKKVGSLEVNLMVTPYKAKLAQFLCP